jgi:hypothetical protein
VRALTRSYNSLGMLWIVYGVICIVEAAWLVVERHTLRLMWGALINRVADPFAWMGYYDILLLAAVTFAIVVAIFSFFGAIALMQHTESRRPLAQIAAILAMIHGPLGVALGVYTLIALFANAGQENYRLPVAA